MGVDISQGGGGGGITIETDPTALKLTGGTLTGMLVVQEAGTSAFAQIVPDIDYPYINISDSGGNWMQYSSSGITFPDGSTQTTAAGGGGSFNGGTVNNPITVTDGGAFSDYIIIGDTVNDSQKGIRFGNYDTGSVYLEISRNGLYFPDGTVQTTAYTGGGGGGGSSSLYARYADIFAEKCYEFQTYLYEDNVDFGMLYGFYVKLNGITGGLPTFLNYMGYNGDGLSYGLSLIGTGGDGAEENGQDINYIGQDSFGWYFTTTPMYVFGNAKPYPFMTYYPNGLIKIRCYAYGQSDYADSFTIYELV